MLNLVSYAIIVNMDYFVIISNKRYNTNMDRWAKTNMDKDTYLWDIAPAAWVLYFKFESDLLVFRLRWGL